MERPSSASSPRRSFLSLGIALTLLGSLIVAAAIAMPGWQILDLPELNAVHEHAIFYDCILSEITPLDALRRALRDVSRSVQPSRRCTYKFATGSPWETAFVRMAIEEGDFAAREHLNLHRFLPQHKAVIFFCVFTLVFGLFSAVVGACSSCFVPNAVLHVISLALAASCSLLADFLFFLASQRDGNRRIQGDAVNYQQHLSYAFFIHCLGSLTLVLALLASIVAAYLLLAKKCREWKHPKTQECLMEEANDANKHDRCLFLSDVLALRPRAGTGLSLEVPQLPPPPPTPQQCQQQHLRLTGRCKEKGLISRSDFNEANPCPSSMLLSPKSSAGSSYCYSAV